MDNIKLEKIVGISWSGSKNTGLAGNLKKTAEGLNEFQKILESFS